MCKVLRMTFFAKASYSDMEAPRCPRSHRADKYIPPIRGRRAVGGSVHLARSSGEDPSGRGSTSDDELPSPWVWSVHELLGTDRVARVDSSGRRPRAR